ncbi:MAG: T9SS type A sorting domain-containing protein [Bacteroidales bacterium]
MKKTLLTLGLIVLCSVFGFSQKSPLWSWPQCRNYNGGVPEQPATIYLGDNGTFGCDSWDMVDGKWPKWQIVIHTAANIDAGIYSSWSSYSNVQHKSGTSPRFTSTGTWYWGVKVEYTDAGGTTGWYCNNNTAWADMYGVPTSNLTISVTALSDPTTPAATVASNSQIDLTWTKWNSKNVMIVRRLTSAGASTAPTQGTAYTVGTTLGTGTVVYNSGGTSFNDTGLTPGTGYTYIFYSENWSYYSAGAPASATTTAVSSATDYFRSKVTGNWSDATTWESSSNNSVWINATLAPASTATATTILSGHTVTLTADAAAKALTVSSGGTLTCGSHSLSIAATGTFTNSSGTFNAGTGNVDFAGTATVSGIVNFNNVTLIDGVNFGSSTTVNGMLTINAGGWVNTNAPTYAIGSTLTYNSGTTYGRNLEWSATTGKGYPYHVQVKGGTTLDLSANGFADRALAGNLLLGGTGSAGSLTMGAMNKKLTIGGDLVIGGTTGTSTLTLSSAVGGDIEINGNWTRNTNGAFTTSERAVFFVGTLPSLISTNNTAQFNWVFINKTGSAAVTLNNALQVNNNLTINGGVLIVSSGTALTVTGTPGTLINNALASALIIKSGGSLIQSSANVSATIERTISAWTDATHGWHFLSSPVASQAIDPAFTNATPANYDFYAWWEPTNTWVNYKNTTTAPTWATANVLGGTSGAGNFIPGKGYLVSYAATDTKQFTGTLNKDNIAVTNLPISTGTNKGWHLLGNPFSSAITWGTNWSLNHISATAKIWKESTASYIDISSGGVIPALNGFMVQVNTGFGGNNSLNIPASARVHDATAWLKSTETPSVVLVANDMAGQTAQESVVRFDNAATASFDPEFDANFLPGYAPLFYSVAGEDHLSTNTLPENGGIVQIPFDFVKNDGVDFTIEAKTISSIIGAVILTDLKTNATQDLTQNPIYTFSSAAGDTPARFKLTFGQVGIGEAQKDKLFNIYAANNSIMLSCKTGNASGNVFVYNMVGQLVAQQELSGSTLTRVNLNAGTGYYLVKVVTSEQTYTAKVFVNQH